MIVSTLLLSVLLSGGAQQARQPVVIGPNPNAAPNTMARFADNDLRNAMQNYLGDMRRQDHRQRVARAEYRDRMSLADRLDRMISEGDCTAARSLASGSTHADIAREVERVCAAREAG